MKNAAFSYAGQVDSPVKRHMIRAIEIATGQPELKRLYLENQRSPKPDESFWAAAVRQLKLDVRFDSSALEKAPKTGPLVVVANHPYGVLDGLVIAWLVEKVRKDFLILTNAVLMQAPEVRSYVLPVDFSGAPGAMETNLNSRNQAREHLEKGGCVIVFPAGGVSTAPDKWGRQPATDAPWGTFTAQLIQRSKADVLPLCFAGQNSRLFQIASHISMTLRLSLIFHEVKKRIGTCLPVAVGDVIPFADIATIKDRQALMCELRQRTYALAVYFYDLAPDFGVRWSPA
ncbi:lysophospholipid acyltransferase family protein [Methylovirgula sp. 4M-Z18]|uniref:lysophospholipid acyltransferase family protein n=1 Tax=Methylovirgula sp. 4M-Z18 TaxID=2293567 RepID=UPI001314DC7E|nr:lysophospholipid acyltransferase family protein [Methylovirgula sp. 4M-Z18]